MERFYYEYDAEEDGYVVIETEGGHEQGAYFDVICCIVNPRSDAVDLCRLLNKLWNNQK